MATNDTITIAEIAEIEDLSRDWILKLKNSYWKDVFPAPLQTKGKALFFDRAEVLAMLKKHPYVKNETQKRIRRGKDDDGFAPREYTLDLDYLNWLSGRNYVQTP